MKSHSEGDSRGAGRSFDALVREGRVSRRGVLRAALALAAAGLAGPLAMRQALAQAQPKPRFTGQPFTLGVASGFPASDSFVIWTRLAPQPLEPDGGVAEAIIDVEWEVAEDERFARIVASGRNRAVSERAHSVHVDVAGLRPDREYHYRFRAGDEVSATGRARTAPAADADPKHLRFAIACCQNFEHGYFAAHRHLLRDDPRLVVFLGDYIYEKTWGTNHVRRHAGGEADTLAGYRVRHAQYRTDADLQALHRAVPFVLSWDDHEVDNDYAGTQSEHLDPQFLSRRAAAYQAYLEHLPLPRRMWPRDGAMRLYDRYAHGSLATFHVTDTRQFRSPQPCPDPARGGGATELYECAELQAPGHGMLGEEQHRWLDEGLAATRARWNFIGQQAMLSRWDVDPGPRTRLSTDGWDGYPESRRRVLEALVADKVGNPIVLGGDLHAHVVANVHRDADDAGSPVVAAEFCTSSLSAQGWPVDVFAPRAAANPHVQLADSSKRGYMLFDLDAKRCEVSIRSLENEKDPASTIATPAKFVVVDGEPGAKPA